MKIKDAGEIGLIRRLARKTRPGSGVVKGIGDDTAVIKWTKDKYLLFTCDMLVEDVHFRRKAATPFEIGWKALGRNISDIAAMGGLPKYAVVSIGLDPELPLSFADGVYKGMASLARKFNVSIVGGDTTRSKKLVIDVSLIGEVEKKNLVLRSGAKAGDLILVTGSIGGSIKRKHLSFTPRVEEARRLVRDFKVNSMIDISDGLIIDLWRILGSSRVGGRIYESAVPLSREERSFDKAIYEGEDFELLFTMSVKEARRFFKTALDRMPTSVALIGEVIDKKHGYKLIREEGEVEELKPKGYLHFQGKHEIYF
ncbi:MAG: thiamine-phosphate kinase [Candidatus Omnitrophota bacterium]|nr:thiamine-phosphate kinase [Candidatus Omnitrophota bacterium]